MKKFVTIMLIALMVIGEAAFVVSAGDSGPSTISDIKAYAAYKGVVVEWTPVSGSTPAASYNVYRSGRLVKNTKSKKFYDRTCSEGGGSTYYVTAVNSNGQEFASSDHIKWKSVSPLFIGMTFRTNRSLKAHDGSGARNTFRRGQRVNASSFQFGKYIFDYKGHTYFVNYNSVTNFIAYTAKRQGVKRNGAPLKYTKAEAEYFVNTTGMGSETGYLLWANLYTQRMYVFKGKKGNWHLTNLSYNGVTSSNWQISSGKATSPSPAALYFEIYKKQRRKNNVNYWNYYFSQTSLHGVVPGQDLNVPRSEGCIRNPDKFALLIYKKIPVGTRVIVY